MVSILQRHGRYERPGHEHLVTVNEFLDHLKALWFDQGGIQMVLFFGLQQLVGDIERPGDTLHEHIWAGILIAFSLENSCFNCDSVHSVNLVCCNTASDKYTEVNELLEEELNFVLYSLEFKPSRDSTPLRS